MKERITQAMAIYKGKTTDATSPILGASFWQKKGTKIEGKVVRNFPTANGLCSEIELTKPVDVNGHSEKRVSIGALKGFGMALAAMGIDTLLPGDKVIIESAGQTKTDKGNPRQDFNVLVDR